MNCEWIGWFTSSAPRDECILFFPRFALRSNLELQNVENDDPSATLQADHTKFGRPTFSPGQRAERTSHPARGTAGTLASLPGDIRSLIGRRGPNFCLLARFLLGATATWKRPPLAFGFMFLPPELETTQPRYLRVTAIAPRKPKGRRCLQHPRILCAFHSSNQVPSVCRGAFSLGAELPGPPLGLWRNAAIEKPSPFARYAFTECLDYWTATAAAHQNCLRQYSHDSSAFKSQYY